MKINVNRILFASAYGLFLLAFGSSTAWAKGPPEPQGAIQCTGWHALCSLATDCRVIDGVAYCDCWKVNEPYVVITADIQDLQVKADTEKACTSVHPCEMDEAPVCKAIKDGTFTVDGIKYEWVSTYSYRGWCDNWNPVQCDAGPWADCMTYPCTENQNPTDPNRPLVCQCTVKHLPFVGSNGGCVTGEGEVMSTINQLLWNFDQNQFTLSMPGYEYVKGACAPILSDPVQ